MRTKLYTISKFQVCQARYEKRKNKDSIVSYLT
jgi:hypothetical protein